MENVKLVNKDYYARCSAIFNKEERALSLDIEKLNDQSIYESMIFSMRRFSSLCLFPYDFNNKHINEVEKILERIGDSVSYLHIFSYNLAHNIPQSILMKFLALMPNLRLISGPSNDRNILDDPDSVLNLPLLQEVRFSSLDLTSKLHQMPSSSLTSLHIDDTPPPNLAQIFERHQATLRKLFLMDIRRYHDPIPFRQLQLESIKFLSSNEGDYRISDEFVYDLLTHQPLLKVLDALLEGLEDEVNYKGSPRVLRMIGTRTELTELHLNFSRHVTASDVFELRNLRKLKFLHIGLAWHFLRQPVHDEEINIEKERIIQILCDLNLPKLIELELKANTGGSRPLSLNMFLDSFPRLRSLKLHEGPYSFNPGRCYEKLIDLTLCGYVFDLMPSFIKSMPKLKIIRFESLYPRISTVRAIINSNISSIRLVIRIVDELSAHKEKKIRKICENYTKKCKLMGSHNATFEVEFREVEL